MNDYELRSTYQVLLQRRTDGVQQVPLEAILDLVEGRGPEDQRLATLDAVMAHPASVREFELLRAMAANRAPQRRRTHWPGLAAAAALVLVLAVPALRQAFTDRAPDAMRDGSAGAVLLTPAEDARPMDARTFTWREVPGARSYTLELLLAGGVPVFTTRTTETSVELPDDLVLAPDTEYRWWVLTEVADGSQLRSPFRRLRVRDR